MKYEFQLCPISIAINWNVDWSRNYASAGSNNSQLKIGTDMKWTFKMRYKIGSPCNSRYANYHHVCII